ncbi:MAG: sodium-dependent transporter [Firmicutes bacterium]|nr:sodium-dependent transporter [Bacillota bacterium]
MAKEREQWRSRVGFVFAAAGSAVGLGNIWRFPTAAGLNGGGAFVLVYLILIFVIGIPLMMVELTLGRRTKRSVIGAFKVLKQGSPWWLVGALGVISGFVILSFYSVIAGWCLAYVVSYATGQFSGLSPGGIEDQFLALVSNPVIPVLWHALFMAMTIGVVILGVAKGIERWSKILMPILLVLLVVLAVRSVTLEGASEGLYWLLRPDFTRLDFLTILGALGQVFFSLSLGMGAMLTYGSYLSKKENIPGSAAYIALTDVGIALLAGLIIIPAVFAFGLDPDTGPPLIFITLPAVFQSIPLGNFFGLMFFLLISIAALTSAISLLEVVVAWSIDELGWQRRRSTILSGLAIFLLGIPSSLSEGVWADFQIIGLNILSFADSLTANLLLPLGGLLTTIFVGWVWGAKKAVGELEESGDSFAFGGVWSVLVKYVMPLILIYILYTGLFPG